jgi:hypothetical protein
MNMHYFRFGSYLTILTGLLMILALSGAGLAQAVFGPPPAPLGGTRVTGQVAAVKATSLLLTMRSGRSLTIDLRDARASHMVPPVHAGEFVQVQGTPAGAGSMKAAAVAHATSAQSAWAPDVP